MRPMIASFLFLILFFPGCGPQIPQSGPPSSTSEKKTVRNFSMESLGLGLAEFLKAQNDLRRREPLRALAPLPLTETRSQV